ncbi:MAG: hypothetical protein N2516_05790 [Dictyoglomaceae bacterium]|nr:hypothetical protein [Dictyoglomaceae bacterium]
MNKEFVDISDNLVILNLSIDDSEIATFLREFKEEERINIAKRVFKIGVLAMNSALFNGTSLFIRESLKNWQIETNNVITEILNKNKELILKEMANCVEENISKNITYRLEDITKNTSERIREKLEDVQKRIDPNHPESYLKVINEAIENIKKEFNPDIEGSYLYKIKNVLNDFYSFDGPAYKCIYDSFDKIGKNLINPLKEMLDKIDNTMIRIGERLQIGHIQRGHAFEEDVLRLLLERISAITGDEIVHVGKDRRSGDWIIKVYYGNINNRKEIGKIVIETKDRDDLDKNDVAKELTEAIEHRDAQIGILVFAKMEQNPYNISFNVIDKDYSKMVCVWDEEGTNLNFAYQLARLILIEKYLSKEGKINWKDLIKKIDDIIEEVNKIDEIIKNAKELKNTAEETFKKGQEIKKNLSSKLNQLKEISFYS